MDIDSDGFAVCLYVYVYKHTLKEVPADTLVLSLLALGHTGILIGQPAGLVDMAAGAG